MHLHDTAVIYKFLMGLTPSYLSSKLTAHSEMHEYYTRNRDQVSLPKCHAVTAQHSFFYRAVESWNSLTGQTRDSPSIPCFKKKAEVEISCT